VCGEVGNGAYVRHRVGWKYRLWYAVWEFEVDEVGLFGQSLRTIACKMPLTTTFKAVGIISPISALLTWLALSLASKLRCVSSLGIPMISSVGSTSPVQVHRDGLTVVRAGRV